MTSQKPQMNLDLDRIRTRAFFLWENKTGKSWWDATSNWREAEREEARAAIEQMPRPTIPYIVVDQNYLRDAALISKLLERAEFENRHILLPDSGLAEMLKGAKWDYAMKRSLEHLSKQPERVVMAANIGVLMKAEESTGAAVDDVVDWEVTAQFRVLLRELGSGTAGNVYAHLMSAITAAQQLANTQHFNHSSNKNLVLDLVKGWKHDLKADEVSRLRSAPTEHAAFTDMMASDSLAATTANILRGAGYDESRAQRLAVVPSVSGVQVLCLAALALKWFVAGGLDTVDAAKITNDLVDLDYVLFGVLAGELHSREKRVLQLYGDMTAVAELRWRSLKDLYVASFSSDPPTGR